MQYLNVFQITPYLDHVHITSCAFTISLRFVFRTPKNNFKCSVLVQALQFLPPDLITLIHVNMNRWKDFQVIHRHGRFHKSRRQHFYIKNNFRYSYSGMGHLRVVMFYLSDQTKKLSVFLSQNSHITAQRSGLKLSLLTYVMSSYTAGFCKFIHFQKHLKCIFGYCKF